MLPEIRTIKVTPCFSGKCQSVQIPRQSEHSLTVTRGLEQLAGHHLCDRFSLPGRRGGAEKGRCLEERKEGEYRQSRIADTEALPRVLHHSVSFCGT